MDLYQKLYLILMGLATVVVVAVAADMPRLTWSAR
jgi:hypothetical protein